MMTCRPPFPRLVRAVLAVALGALVLAPAICLGAERSASYLAALESIRAEDLARHVDHLADSALEGRESGTRGGRAAADYLAAQFERLGLAGAGVDGGYHQPFAPNFRNVLAMLRGADPERRGEYVVVGAHYDHVGYGTPSNSRGPVGYVHPGADDNASGTATMLEVAEAFTFLADPPPRSVLFIAFDAEEKGLLGSRHWTARPTAPIDRVVAMLNLDMVGRLRDDRLTVAGSRSGSGWRRLVARQNDGADLKLEFSWLLKDHADHWPFYARGVPVLMFHTGTHDDYHRPSDTADRIDHDGMTRVARLVFQVVCELAEQPGRIAYRPDAERETEAARRQAEAEAPKLTDRLGVGWDPAAPTRAGGGLRLTRILAGSAAEKAGLRPGDRIVRFADREIASGDDLFGAVRTAASPATAVVERPGEDQPLELLCELPGQPMRLGILWRLDAAEPGTVVVARVVPGTPAAAAGLTPGDRIDRLGGRAFADEAEFARLARQLPFPVEATIERDGRLRTVLLHAVRDDPAVPVGHGARAGQSTRSGWTIGWSRGSPFSSTTTKT